MMGNMKRHANLTAIRHYQVPLWTATLTYTADECDTGMEISAAEIVSTEIYGNNIQTLEVCQMMKIRR
jgi:hypothetical protein